MGGCMKKRFYGYNSFNQSISSKTVLSGGVATLLNVPLSHFKKTSGCAEGNAYKLGKFDIGKAFDVLILDPVHVGKCKFLGRGFDAIPESNFKVAIKGYKERINYHRKFLVFEKMLNREKIFIVINEIWCDANPIKAKK